MPCGFGIPAVSEFSGGRFSSGGFIFSGGDFFRAASGFSGRHFQAVFLAGLEFSGGDFFSGGFRIFWSSLSGVFFWRVQDFLAVSDCFWIFFLRSFFLVVFRISWRSQNFLAVIFPNFLVVSESAQMRLLCSNHSPFPTTGSEVAGRGLCHWVGGSNPTF